MGLPTFFFLFFFFRRFFRRHVLCPFIVKKTTDLAEILHNHAYGHASGRGKKYFRCAHFPLSYVSKITQKNFRNSQHRDEKSDWADILQKHAYGQSTDTVKKWFG